MSTGGATSQSIRRQLQRLLFVLVLITGTNALFLWNTQKHLIASYQSENREQKIISMAGDLERDFFEEKKLKNFSEASEKDKMDLDQVRANIKKLFKGLRENISDKYRVEKIRTI